MFSPEMMKQAQDMMSNMSPEQMRQMTEMASKMDPKMMQQAMQGMGGPSAMPSPDQMRQAQEKMKNMSSEEIEREMAQAQEKMKNMTPSEMAAHRQQLAEANQYWNAAALRCKNEGNQLVGKKDFAAAKPKYLEGLENCKKCTETDVKQACTLNLALCHLKLGENEDCITLCSEVLGTTKNMKALYRRGAARLAIGEELVDSYADLARAAEMAGDAPANAMIHEEFEKCKKVAEEKGLLEECEKKVSEVDDAEEKVSEVVNATSTAADSSQPSSGAATNSTTTPPSGFPMPPPGLSPLKPGQAPTKEHMEAAKSAMNNPDMMKQATSMMQGMDPKALASMMGKSEAEAEQMKSAMDMMNNNPEMMKTMQDMMSNMSPEEMESMMKLQGGPGGPGMPAGPGGAPGGMPPNMSFTDPNTIKHMETVVGGFAKKPETFVKMAQASGANIPEGGVPETAIKWFAKCLPILLACWRYILYVKQAVVWMFMSKKGRLLCALFILIFAIYQGLSYQSLAASPNPEDADDTPLEDW